MNHIGVAVMNAGGSGGMPNPAAVAPPGPRMDPNDDATKTRLNTLIYDYFLKNEMVDCARALIENEVPINFIKGSPGQRRDADGNLLSHVGDDGAMDTDIKEELDSKRPDALPVPKVSPNLPLNSFLYDWFCLFWDVFAAQRKLNPENAAAVQYLHHTQVCCLPLATTLKVEKADGFRTPFPPPPGWDSPWRFVSNNNVCARNKTNIYYGR